MGLKTHQIQTKGEVNRKLSLQKKIQNEAQREKDGEFKRGGKRPKIEKNRTNVS